MTSLNHEKTEYSKIYRNTYWGNGGFNNDMSIIENRNKFIKDYNIKNICNKRIPLYIHEIIDRNKKSWRDHQEVYKNKNNEYVLIISPYYGDDKDDLIKIIRNYGWDLIYNLYNDFSLSFVKIVSIKKNQNKVKRVSFTAENHKILVSIDRDFIHLEDEKEIVDYFKSNLVNKYDIINFMSGLDFPCYDENICECEKEFDPYKIIYSSLSKIGYNDFNSSLYMF